MAVGLTPTSSIDTGLDGLSPSQFLALCVDAAHSRGWDVRFISESGLIAHTSKKMFKRKQEVTIRIADGIANIRSESIGNEMIDWGRNKLNVQQFVDALTDRRAALSPEQLNQLYVDLMPQIAQPENDILSRPAATAKEQWFGFLSLFVPRSGFFVTPILIDINIIIFIGMVISGAGLVVPGTQSLIQWGANIRYLTLDHQWWRLITCCFVHIGIFHLLFNMYALMYIGILLEPQLGRLRIASAYLLTGIIASLASLFWHEHTLSAGASGAIFGMYGLFLALLTTNLIDKTRRIALLTSIGIFVGYNLLYGAKGGIDNAAHIGGLLSGILIGYLYYPGLKRPGPGALQYSGMTVAAIAVLATCLVAFKKIPNYYGQYDQKMRLFARYERRALAIFDHNDSDTPKEKWLSALRDTGINNWNQAIYVLNQVKALPVAEPVKQRTDILIQYCNLRIASYNYYVEKWEGTVAPGEDSVTIYNSEINDLVASLKRSD